MCFVCGCRAALALQVDDVALPCQGRPVRFGVFRKGAAKRFCVAAVVAITQRHGPCFANVVAKPEDVCACSRSSGWERVGDGFPGAPRSSVACA